MLPGIYEFEWDPGHIIFLGIFYAVVAIVVSTVLVALVRGIRGMTNGKLESARWHADFEDLPESAKRCRHELSGEVGHRTCPNAFDCRHCTEHPKFVQARDAADALVAVPAIAMVGGFALPGDRLYHRGHTWVHVEDDGLLTIGLDDLGSHLMGRAESLVLPEPGTKLVANGTGWHATKNGSRIRILSPIDGEVVTTGGPEDGWTLKVRPHGDVADVRHLLTAAEARPWMLREVERLQMALSVDGVGAALADGGMPIDDLSQAIPSGDLEAVCGMMFLEP